MMNMQAPMQMGYGPPGMHPGPQFDTRKLFVGNVAWEVQPTTVLPILQEAGHVLDFQLRADPSGRNAHRGFGYVVYADDASAQRALQHLNGRMIMHRPLKVSIMETGGHVPATHHYQGGGARGYPGAGAGAGPSTSSSSPVGMSAPVPEGMPTPATVASQMNMPASVRSVLESMSGVEVNEVLKQLKQLAETQPQYCKDLLLQSPMLAHTVLNMLSTSQALTQQTAAYMVAMAAKEAAAAHEAAAAAAQQQQVPPSPSSSAASGSQAAASAAASEHAQLVRSVMAMSDEEVNAMPPDQREGAEQIRMVLMMPMEMIHGLPPGDREQMLELRRELEAVIQSG